MKWVVVFVALAAVVYFGIGLSQQGLPSMQLPPAWDRVGGLWSAWDNEHHVVCYAVATGIAGRGPDDKQPITCVYVPIYVDDSIPPVTP